MGAINNRSPVFVVAVVTSSVTRAHLLVPTVLLLLTCALPPLGRIITGASAVRPPLRYSSYPHDEVNFSLSQEESNPASEEDNVRMPEFVGQVPNVTVQVGRDARMACVIQNLATFRTAWIRDEEKSILTLQRQMVTRDPRISLQEENQMDIGVDEYRDPNRIRYFVLIIKNVQVSDRGGYMCQINTVPMKSQIGFLQVVVPPDIIDHQSSNDVTVVEGANVTLKCKARGHPQPVIEWRREDGNRVPLGDRNTNRRVMTNKTEGEHLEMTRVTRVHSGAWLCIASNGVMPSVSRRILLNVQFSPQIWIPIEEIGAPFGSNITLDCHIEAYPLPLNYWTFGSHSESIYISGPKYEVSVKEKGYKRHLRLTIYRLESSDLGTYRCHAQNSLGRQEKLVRVYASDTHQQTQSIDPSKTTSGERSKNGKRKKDRKRKKIKSKDTVNGSGGGSDHVQTSLLYSVINSFRNTGERDQQMTKGKDSTYVNDQQRQQDLDEEFEMYDDDEDGGDGDQDIADEDDYAQYSSGFAPLAGHYLVITLVTSVSIGTQIVCLLN